MVAGAHAAQGHRPDRRLLQRGGRRRARCRSSSRTSRPRPASPCRSPRCSPRWTRPAARVVKLEDPPTPPKIGRLLAAAARADRLRRARRRQRLLGAAPRRGRHDDRLRVPGDPPAIRVAFEAGDTAAGRERSTTGSCPTWSSRARSGSGSRIRKEVLRRRGVLATARTRALNPLPDPATLAELDDVLARVGLTPGLEPLELARDRRGGGRRRERRARAPRSRRRSPPHGSDLLLWSRSKERSTRSPSASAPEHGVTVHTVAADAGDPDAAADRRRAWPRPSSAASTSACSTPADRQPATADQTDAEGWRAALQLLTVTPIDLATRLLPGMRERGFGRIIAVLSSGVREPLPDLSYSNGGRAALAAWLKTVSAATSPPTGSPSTASCPGGSTPTGSRSSTRPRPSGPAPRSPRSSGEHRPPSRPAATAGRRSSPRPWPSSPRTTSSYVTGVPAACGRRHDAELA